MSCQEPTWLTLRSWGFSRDCDHHAVAEFGLEILNHRLRVYAQLRGAELLNRLCDVNHAESQGAVANANMVSRPCYERQIEMVLNICDICRRAVGNSSCRSCMQQLLTRLHSKGGMLDVKSEWSVPTAYERRNTVRLTSQPTLRDTRESATFTTLLLLWSVKVSSKL